MSAPAPVPVGPMAVNFGFTQSSNGTSGIVMSGTGVGTLTLQDMDHTKNADEDPNRDALGRVLQITYYNQNEDAKLEVLITAAGVAAAITATALPEVGAIITISECLSYPALVGTNWIVQPGINMKGSNTNAKKASYPLKRYGGITAGTPA